MLKRWTGGAPRPPAGYDVDVWRLARANARETFIGPTPDEPHVDRQLRELIGDLVRTFRNDAELRAARAALGAAEQAVLAARERLAGGGMEPPAVPAFAVARAEHAARARTAQREARHALRTAEARYGDAQGALREAEAAVLDRLADAGTRGLDRVNEYVAAFNLVRQYEGRPGLEPLADDFLENLVRRAVQPLLAEGS